MLLFPLWIQGAIALTIGSVPRRTVFELPQFDWLFIFNNQWKWRNSGTILLLVQRPPGSQSYSCNDRFEGLQKNCECRVWFASVNATYFSWISDVIGNAFDFPILFHKLNTLTKQLHEHQSKVGRFSKISAIESGVTPLRFAALTISI